MSFDHDSICYFSHCPMPLYIVVEPFQIVNPKVKDSYINLNFQNLPKKSRLHLPVVTLWSRPNDIGDAQVSDRKFYIHDDYLLLVFL